MEREGRGGEGEDDDGDGAAAKRRSRGDGKKMRQPVNSERWITDGGHRYVKDQRCVFVRFRGKCCGDETNWAVLVVITG